MLPGFRFLFAAIVLSMSVLVFGLGAAALLRAAHEQFASIPSRRATPEPVFAQHNEPPVPTLALLRFEPPVLEQALDNTPADVVAVPEPATPGGPAVTIEQPAAAKTTKAKPDRSAIRKRAARARERRRIAARRALLAQQAAAQQQANPFAQPAATTARAKR